MNVRATAPSAGSTGPPGLDEAPSDGWVRAAPPRRPVLFVNPRSGGGKAARVGLAERARERGIEAIVLGAGDDLRAVSRDAVAGGADALGMAGGDGSLVPVAEAAAANGVPFVPVPAGTRNHFALDVGADPGDLVGALDAFLYGFERNVDMAEVNGRTFLNNVSLGVYGEAVQRPGYRDAKIRTLLETARVVLGPGASAPALRLVDDAGREYQDPAVVLVSNNAYALERAVGTRGTACTRQRPARDRRALPSRSGSSACRRELDRTVARDRRCGTAARRHRRRSGSPHPAAPVRDAAAGAAGKDRCSPPERRAARRAGQARRDRPLTATARPGARWASGGCRNHGQRHHQHRPVRVRDQIV